jgi:hypothetical protein
MANALVNVAALRAKLAGLGSERQIVEIDDGRGTFDSCEDPEQVAKQWAISELDGMTNARWRQIDEADYAFMASIFLEFWTRAEEFKRSIEARPSTAEKPIIRLTAAPK